MAKHTLVPTQLTGLRIFISYPRGGQTHTWAKKIHTDLAARGAEVWRDERSIAEGTDDWLKQLRTGLERAEVVVSVVGADSDNCTWQQREMIHADRVGLPRVALRTRSVALPVYMNELQPVELRDPDAPAASFETLAAAVLQARNARAAPTLSAYPPTNLDPQQRDRERAYLRDLLAGDLSTHEARYAPVSGQERREPSFARTHKGLRHEQTSILKIFKQETLTATMDAPRECADVLEVYRDLPSRQVRRLAVLGEPGAGKTFSLERFACDFARRAVADPTAPIPLLLRLGLWTRERDSIGAFIEAQLGALGRHFTALRDQHRAVLLLDGLNEIPPQQRQLKAPQIRELAEDARFAAVILSCRERDFTDDYRLPFDTLTIQPLTPLQIQRFLTRGYSLQEGASTGAARAEDRFWQIAGGAELRAVWQTWQDHGATFEQFWAVDDLQQQLPQVYAKTSGAQDACWRAARDDPRNLLRLAANPYVLFVMMQLPAIPSNRAQLFESFLQLLFEREQGARERRNDADSVPDLTTWLAALADLAAAMQQASPPHADAGARGAATALAGDEWPPSLKGTLIDFSIDASVLQRMGEQIRFTHQLLQEALAARVLVAASITGARAATAFWPRAAWWQRCGWEVVAEIAAESCAHDSAALHTLLAWLASAQPEVASQVWRRAGSPGLPAAVTNAIAQRWLPRLTDAGAEPAPAARAAIGRALAAFDLDQRPGVGLRVDGLPDVDWVPIAGGSFVYQDGEQRQLAAFEIARYPVTYRQFEAFISAGGYADDRWWVDLGKRIAMPATPCWQDANAPRETVSWYEAVAFCRWLSHALGCTVQLPTEAQWERAARGRSGAEYPWGEGYRAGCANCYEAISDEIEDGTVIGRTTAVGIYPFPSADGVFDLAGNVWEWCLNEYEQPKRTQRGGQAARVVRGGSWDYDARGLRAAVRRDGDPGFADDFIGLRVCRGSPIIESLAVGTLITGPLPR